MLPFVWNSFLLYTFIDWGGNDRDKYWKCCFISGENPSFLDATLMDKFMAIFLISDSETNCSANGWQSRTDSVITFGSGPSKSSNFGPISEKKVFNTLALLWYVINPLVQAAQGSRWNRSQYKCQYLSWCVIQVSKTPHLSTKKLKVRKWA